jgi:hypothetical protein
MEPGQLQVADAFFSANRAGNGATAVRHAFPSGAPDNHPGTSGGSGGAILVEGGSASITNVTVAGSRAGRGGAGENPVTLIAGNGGDGGAIAVIDGSATVVNGTFQGNRAGDGNLPALSKFPSSTPGGGGAVAAVAPGALAITFSTFSGNAVGGRADGVQGVGASVLGASVGGSILADVGGACATSTPSSPANVVLPGNTSCPGTRIAGDPRLGALADNGGPVPTMSLGAGSPAIDALIGVPCPATDARGQVRPRFAGCDAGAVEIQPGSAAAPRGGGGRGARPARAG